MAVIHNDGSRPFLAPDSFANASVGEPWSGKLAAAQAYLSRAVRAVGKVELPSFLVATGFVVAPRLAVTASFVADGLQARAQRVPFGWLDFADDKNGQVGRIAIAQVQKVHPNWRFAFLVLEKAVPADCVLGLAEPNTHERVADRDICIIGYPQGAQKRLMPGTVQGFATFDESAPVLQHDASTVGGASGAPLVDLETGRAIGMHFAGRPSQANYAAPAWEFNRDPQWDWLWEGAARPELPGAGMAPASMPLPAAPSPPTTPRPRPTAIFSSRRLIELQNILVEHRIPIDVVLRGLPTALVAELAELATPQHRMFAALAGLNRMFFVTEEELPIEALLNYAEGISFTLQQSQALAPFKEAAKHARLALSGAPGG